MTVQGRSQTGGLASACLGVTASCSSAFSIVIAALSAFIFIVVAIMLVIVGINWGLYFLLIGVGWRPDDLRRSLEAQGLQCGQSLGKDEGQG